MLRFCYGFVTRNFSLVYGADSVPKYKQSSYILHIWQLYTAYLTMSLRYALYFSDMQYISARYAVYICQNAKNYKLTLSLSVRHSNISDMQYITRNALYN